ncbi:unnamed protein product [Vicia faba]|uniref:Uncharacterized protein n=1 Tax=Vicia faba TaxID=3906 RepID=A0AAV1AG73_VICFA|nr:unnamed protein product [Vicia faba]
MLICGFHRSPSDMFCFSDIFNANSTDFTYQLEVKRPKGKYNNHHSHQASILEQQQQHRKQISPWNFRISLFMLESSSFTDKQLMLFHGSMRKGVVSILRNARFTLRSLRQSLARDLRYFGLATAGADFGLLLLQLSKLGMLAWSDFLAELRFVDKFEPQISKHGSLGKQYFYD